MMRFLKRVAPWPYTSAFMFAVWLLLNQSIAPGHIVLGALLAVLLPWWTAPLLPGKARMRPRPGAALRLVGVLLHDSFLSNLAVAKVILGPAALRSCSGFVTVPLALRNPHGQATLAAMITAIPGTVGVELADDGSELTLHVLDLSRGSQYWIDTVKQRYERLLMEIFP